MPIPTTAIKLKRLRQQFGINAPRLSIRRHVPWYWRALPVVGVAALLLTILIWFYGLGGSFWDPDHQDVVKEKRVVEEKVSELTAELEQLRVLAKTMESSLQIEHTLQQQLSSHVKQLETENAALKQDLAFFETLMPTSMQGEEGLKIDRFRVLAGNTPKEYRYQMLVINNSGRQAKEIKGTLHLQVNMRQEGKDVMMNFPLETDPDPQRFRFEVKYFCRLEGVFSVPEGAEIKSVEARLMQESVVRAKQSVSL